MKFIYLLATLPFLGATALAQDSQSSHLWVSIGYTLGDVDSNNTIGSNDDFAFDSVEVGAGADFGKYIGVEVEGYFPTSKTTLTRNDKSVKVGINNGLGAALRVRYPLSDSFEVYAKGGFAQFNFVVRDPDFGNEFESTKDIDDSGTGLGLGLKWDIGRSGNNHLGFEFVKYDFDKVPTSTFSIAYIRSF